MTITPCRICLEFISGASIISVQAKVTDEKNVLEAIKEVAGLKGSSEDYFPQYVCKKCLKLLKSTVTFRRLILSSHAEFKEKLSRDQQDESKNVSNVNYESIKFEIVKSQTEISTTLKNEHDFPQIPEMSALEDNRNEEVKTESEEDFLEYDNGSSLMGADQTKVLVNTKSRSKIKRISKTRNKSKIVSENISLICSFCGKVVKGKQNFNAHLRMHNSQIPPLVYVCPVCPKQFSKKKYLLVHRRSHTGEKPFHCDICNKNFSQFASFYVHKRRLHDKVVQGTCSYCGKKFVDKPELDVHIKMWHTETPGEVNMTETIFQCITCSQYFNKKCALLSHEKACGKTHNCGKCNKTFSRASHLNRHHNRCSGKPRVIQHTNYCGLCSFESSKKSVLEEHYVAVHSAKIFRKQRYFNAWEEFLVWKNKFEIETKSLFTNIGTSCKKYCNTTRYVCNRDGYFKPKGKGIRNLQLLDTNKINGYCPAKIVATLGEDGSINVVYCDTHVGHNLEIKRVNFNLTEGPNSILVEGERPYLCEFCSATFVCNRTLQRHRRELHSEKKPCHKCGKMLGDYALKKHLVRHKVLDEGLKIIKKKYTCEYCKTVMNFTSRRRHLEKQHGVKLYGRGDDCKKIHTIIKDTAEST